LALLAPVPDPEAVKLNRIDIAFFHSGLIPNFLQTLWYRKIREKKEKKFTKSPFN
jgi:hypothetical protein